MYSGGDGVAGTYPSGGPGLQVPVTPVHEGIGKGESSLSGVTPSTARSDEDQQ